MQLEDQLNKQDEAIERVSTAAMSAIRVDSGLLESPRPLRALD